MKTRGMNSSMVSPDAFIQQDRAFVHNGVSPVSEADLTGHVESRSGPSIDINQWKMMQVVQGEYVISGFEDACLTTLLGSCVATCLWDPEIRLGGMNHYLLPAGRPKDANHMRFGVNAMELLINGMLKRGAHKSRLVAKVFGGAQMLSAASDIGTRNVEFAQRFLADEGIAEIRGSIGGTKGRRVRFFPADGRVQQKFIKTDDLPDSEVIRQVPPETPAATGNLELF